MPNLGAKPGKATLLQLSPPNTEVLVRYHLDRVSLRLRPRLPGFTVFEYFWYISNIPENYARRAYLDTWNRVSACESVLALLSL